MAKTKSYAFLYVSLWDPYMAHVQIDISGSYMDVVFKLKLVADDESEIWTSLSHSFTKGGLLQVSG